MATMDLQAMVSDRTIGSPGIVGSFYNHAIFNCGGTDKEKDELATVSSPKSETGHIKPVMRQCSWERAPNASMLGRWNGHISWESNHWSRAE